MAKPKAALSKEQRLKEFRSNVAWVVYVSPFRVIVPDNEKPLEVSIDEINSNTYNHGALVRIVTGLPLAAEPDFKLLVGWSLNSAMNSLRLGAGCDSVGWCTAFGEQPCA